MKASWFCIQIAFLLAVIRTISSVNLVVLRDEDSSSKSAEESEEGVSSDESREIDLLMELIEKESRERKVPPVKTVRVVRRKPNKEPTSQHSFRNGKIQSPKQAKEYHVHYHNHQHPTPDSIKPEEDKLKPIIWESLSSHLNAFPDIYSLPQFPMTPLMSLSDVDRFRQFKDFEALLGTRKRIPGEKHAIRDSSREFQDYFAKKGTSSGDTYLAHTHIRDHDHFDDTIVQHPPSAEQTANEKNLERLKRYQALLNSRFKSPSQSHKDDFPNRDRFAGFTDFSALESSQPKTRSKEAENSKIKEQEDLEIKDYAIVIKNKPRLPPPPAKKDIQQVENQAKYRKRGPAKLPTPKEVRTRQNRPLSVPRILDSPGGAPQFIEKLNQLNFGKENGIVNFASQNILQHNLNSVESQHRQMFRLRPVPRSGFNSHIYDGWLIQRVLR